MNVVIEGIVEVVYKGMMLMARPIPFVSLLSVRAIHEYFVFFRFLRVELFFFFDGFRLAPKCSRC